MQWFKSQSGLGKMVILVQRETFKVKIGTTSSLSERSYSQTSEVLIWELLVHQLPEID